MSDRLSKLSILFLLIPILLCLSIGCSTDPIGDFHRAIQDDPPQPTQNYGEFPFKLVYEKNGERIVVEDVLVIEYLGINYTWVDGKYNDWNLYWKNSDTSAYQFPWEVPLSDDPQIYFELGTPEYYMGLPDDNIADHLFMPAGSFVINAAPPYKLQALSEERLLEEFNIKIIEASISEPIS